MRLLPYNLKEETYLRGNRGTVENMVNSGIHLVGGILQMVMCNNEPWTHLPDTLVTTLSALIQWIYPVEPRNRRFHASPPRRIRHGSTTLLNSNPIQTFQTTLRDGSDFRNRHVRCLSHPEEEVHQSRE